MRCGIPPCFKNSSFFILQLVHLTVFAVFWQGQGQEVLFRGPIKPKDSTAGPIFHWPAVLKYKHEATGAVDQFGALHNGTICTALTPPPEQRYLGASSYDSSSSPNHTTGEAKRQPLACQSSSGVPAACPTSTINPK